MTTFATKGLKTKTIRNCDPDELDEEVNAWLSKCAGTVQQISFAAGKSRTHADGGYTTMCVHIVYTDS